MPAGPCGRAGPALVALLVLAAGLAQAQSQATNTSNATQNATVQNQTCMSILLNWSPVKPPPTASALQKCDEDMLRFCAKFDRQTGELKDVGERCYVQRWAASTTPRVSVVLNGCCEGKTAKNLMAEFKDITDCHPMGIGRSFPLLKVDIVPGKPPQGSGSGELVNGTLSGVIIESTGSSHTLTSPFSVEQAFRDWRFWVPILIVTVVMVSLCVLSICCLCKRYKKKERDRKYQLDREVHLLKAQLASQDAPAMLPAVTPMPVEDKPIVARRQPLPHDSDPSSPLIANTGGRSEILMVQQPVQQNDLVVRTEDDSDSTPLAMRQSRELEYSDSSDGEELDRHFASQGRNLSGGGGYPAYSGGGTTEITVQDEVIVPAPPAGAGGSAGGATNRPSSSREMASRPMTPMGP